jgi:hypothetical protein
VARAVPAGIVGFLLGALAVIALRGLQGVEPVWDAEMALVLAAFTSAGMFIWGMGGFNPATSVHPHEPEVDEYGLIVREAEPDPDPETVAEPGALFGWSLWQVTFWTIVLFGGLIALATLPSGPALRISNDPVGDPQLIGYQPLRLPFSGDNLTFRGETVLFSELTMFILFGAFTLLSLAVIGGGLAFTFYALSQGVTVARATQPDTVARVAPARPAGLLASGHAETPAAETGTNPSAIQSLISRAALYILGVPALAYLIAQVVYMIEDLFGDVVVEVPGWRLAIYFLIAGALITVDFTRRRTQLAQFAILGAVLYFIFYHVAIGLVIAAPDWLRISVSLVNVVVIAALIVYPKQVVTLVGRSAGAAARTLRQIGTVR